MKTSTSDPSSEGATSTYELNEDMIEDDDTGFIQASETMKSACAVIALLSAVLVESQSSICSGVQTTNPPRENLFLCYWGAWSYYREGDGKFSVEHIDPFLCTHLVYTFAILENDLITAYDPYLDLTDNWGLGERLKEMLQLHVCLK
ncbi:chitinase-3-like protein 1 [Ixodes scapularis]